MSIVVSSWRRSSTSPLPEQRRIAAILDKADALRAKRRAALAQLDTLTQSIFLDMFGDPATDPKGWPVRTFDETMRDETSKTVKLQRSNYLPEGRYPVVDQGQAMIAGYCDDDRYLCTSELPVVVFGDHTRAVKLIRHRFVVGADGARVLVPKPGVDAVYLAYLMRELPIPDLGYSRHMREVKRLAFPIPPNDRQQEFAQRVSSLEMHCKAHDRSIALGTRRPLRLPPAPRLPGRAVTMRGEFIGVWSETWREIWLPLIDPLIYFGGST